MDDYSPSPEELVEWQETAAKRNAVLPARIEIKGHHVAIACVCGEIYTRKLLAKRNDPLMVCPCCSARNYVPVEW